MQECMGRLHIKGAEYNYKEHDRQLKEWFFNGLDNEGIMQELTAKRNSREIDIEQVLIQAPRVEAQRVQKRH